MSILVTGGSGFIGSNFILNFFEKSDEQIINVDKLTYAGNNENLREVEGNYNYIFLNEDISNKLKIIEVLKKYKPRSIINFAAESHVDRSIDSPEIFIETNVLGTFRLLQESKEYWNSLYGDEKNGFRFLHVSTDEVYGTLEANDPPFSETNSYYPNSPYSASKASSDHMVRSFYHTYGLPVLTTNCSNNYGPYQFPEKLIPLIINNCLEGKKLPIYGDGKQIRDWLYVKDHCNAIMKVLDKGRIGEVYNIGGLNEKTNIEIVTLICNLLDKKIPNKDCKSYKDNISYVKDRPGHDRRYAIDSSKIMNELNWKPDETFDTGITKTVEWYLNNLDWVNNIRSGEYRKWIEHQYK